MGFRDEIEAREAQLAKLRRENDELRDELARERREEAEREERERAQASKRLFGAKRRKKGTQAAARPTHELDPACAPTGMRLGSWLVAVPCLALAWGACALVFRWASPSDSPLWLRQVLVTVFVLLMTPAIRNNVVFGVASVGDEGFRRLSSPERSKSALLWLGACVLVGLMAGFADGDT